MFFFFNDYKDALLEAFELPEIKDLANSDEFYYQKAKDKFDEFFSYDASGVDLFSLIAATKQQGFSFKGWLNSYNAESMEYRFLLLIGQIISYFDTNAAMKNELNEYEDKRILAKAMVRQNIWVKWLLEFKLGTDINTFPGSIRNAILFIQKPEENINILSDDYRKTISDELFDGKSLDYLFEGMKNLGIRANNPLNNGVLYTLILYSETIKELWFEDKENDSAILTNETVLKHLGGLKEIHHLLTRAKLFELTDGSKVLIRGSKLLPTGRYFYGLQNAIVESEEAIDYIIFVKGNEGFYKIPYSLIKKLCLDGSISFADKGKSANEAVKGYRINFEFNKETNTFELKLIGEKAPVIIDEYFYRVKGASTRDSDIRYWIYTPGEQARLWGDFHNEGIMGIGWDGVGDLSTYTSKNNVKAALQEMFSDNRSHKNDTHALWEFANKISIGDIVFVKKGYSVVLGRGIVESEYIFDDNREEYKHIRKVNWTHFGEWEDPGQAIQKTLADITSFTDYVEKLEVLFRDESELPENDEDKPKIQYPTYTEEHFLKDVYMSPKLYKTLKGLLLRKKNIILQGAPGVGKTFAAKRLAFSIIGKKDTSRVRIVQFHQSYSYEDFIMGWRPDGSSFKLEEGPFYKFCKLAEVDDENEPYFFIIDEINRGILSKIFGELLMLIEGDKRGDSIKLLYKDEQFSVPNNIHIIGMMNTADRSLAMIDYALRRRFAFFDMAPAFQSDGFIAYQKDISNNKLDNLIAVVERLNIEIGKDASLGDGFRIGHSYFCADEDVIIDDDWLSDVVVYELIPLLSEYWFDEPKKYDEWSRQLRSAINV